MPNTTNWIKISLVMVSRIEELINIFANKMVLILYDQMAAVARNRNIQQITSLKLLDHFELRFAGFVFFL